MIGLEVNAERIDTIRLNKNRLKKEGLSIYFNLSQSFIQSKVS